MKNFNKLLAFFLVFFCLKTLAQDDKAVASHGMPFMMIEDVEANWRILEELKEGSPLTTQLSGKITEVCQAKGCWMKVLLANGSEVFVKFKDYGFFVPTDVAGNNVVMQGDVLLETLSVDTQKHYAKDKGASDGELDMILKPKRTLAFVAEGVSITSKH